MAKGEPGNTDDDQSEEQRIAKMNEDVAAYQRAGAIAEGVALADKAFFAAFDVLPEGHFLRAQSARNRAIMHRMSGNMPEAVRTYAVALHAYEKTLEAVSRRREELASSGNFQDALEAGKDATTLARNVEELKAIVRGGESRGDVGYAVFELAKLALRLGQYELATTCLDEAESIAREEFGPGHVNYPVVLEMRAKLKRHQGRPEEALPILEEAVERLRANTDRPDYVLAVALNNFGSAQKALGMYGQAERQFQEAIELVKHGPAAESQKCYVSALGNLADLYNDIGQDERARPLLMESLDVARRIFSPGDPAVAAAMNNLGVYMLRHGDAEAGLKLCQEASTLVEKSLGRHSFEYATSLSTVANALRKAHRYEEAEVYCVFALEYLRKDRPETSSEIADTLIDLALVYRCRGKFDQAEGALRRSVEIFDETLPHDHRNAIEARFSLFVALAAQQKHRDAFEVLKEAIASESNVMDAILRLGSEKDRMEYLTSLLWHTDASLAFVVKNGLSNHTFVEWAFDLMLRRKGLAAEALSTQRDVVWRSATAELKDKLERLNLLKLQIGRVMLSVQPDEGREARVSTLEIEKADLERELAASVPEIGLKLKLEGLNWKTIADELGPTSALIEFVRYSDWRFDAVVAQDETLNRPDRYAVFVVRNTPSVELIDLGEASPIDRAVEDFRTCLTGEDRRSNGAMSRFSLSGALAAIIPSARRKREEQLNTLGRKVAQAVLSPVTPGLVGVNTLLVAPDGRLLSLPFDCLPDNGGCWLDRAEIIYIGSGREIAGTTAFSATAPASPVIIADPDFDLRNAVELAPLMDRKSRALSQVDWRFTRLNGTRAEGEMIGTILGVEPLFGAAANTSAVKKSRSPRILHIATHGFFLDSKKPDPSLSGSTLSVIDRLAMLENPLLRSGLALAGANSFLEKKPLPEDAEDGIITAEDVTGLDLRSTELVVLSACDTGLGEIHSGEGLFGFRRAFSLAGARMLVVSLWKVADAETEELMQSFYTNLKNGNSAQVALYNAKLEVRTRHPDPFYWAAFICIGYPRDCAKDK